MRDYDRKDITGLRNYLVSLIDAFIEQYGVRNWSDRNESDMGMLFLELAAGMSDMLDYYLDKQALENYLPTATVRRNLKRIVSLVDYQLMGPVPSRVPAVFELSRHMDFDFTIPKYFQVSYSRGRGNIYYATSEDILVPAGTTTIRADLLQGIVNEVNMTVADLTRNRKVTLDSTSVAQSSVCVFIGGEEWTRVDDVLIEDVFGRKFSVYEDIDDRPVVEFGYSYEDYLPKRGDGTTDIDAPVVIKFLNTAGAHGNVSAGKIDTIEGSLEVNGHDIASLMSVSNLQDSVGGRDREDMESARIMAPHVWHSERRMTTEADYRRFIEGIDGVQRAQVITWETDEGKYIYVPYQVSVYVLPDGDGLYTPKPEFLSAITEAISPYLWCSIDLYVLPAVIRDIDVKVLIDTGTDRHYNYSGLREEMELLFGDFFEKEKRSFGEKFTIGQLEAVARQSTLVNRVTILEPSSIVELERYEFPRLGNLEIEIKNGLVDE